MSLKLNLKINITNVTGTGPWTLDFNIQNVATQFDMTSDLSVGDYIIGNNIILYPNPAANTFTIANLSETISKVEILDLQGKVIPVKFKTHENTVDISNLQPAMYIVKIYAATTIYTQQIIKK